MLARLLAAFLPILLVAACAPSAQHGPVVLAASSMQEAVDDIADAWAAAGHPRPVVSFAGTPALARQVEAGAPADIFISADEQWMDVLAQKQLIRPATRRDIAGNELVFIVPASSADVPQSGPLAMADPDSVPAGRYGKAALEQLGRWDALKPRIVPTENVRAALALVERGEAPQGLVYASDAAASKAVKVAEVIPADSHPPIRYPMAVLAASRHPDAQGLADFIASPAGQAILQRHGFRPAR
ncbi:MAG: molybdate ABC transporter substrate-binding protein [Sphingomonadales bacterium]|nr:molybdate ABC transporter substrate-binding protein [Sphingomonadales bacterium]MBD3774534.1 molybdate ABC transporter substrate-binding protein [Paracoccaceae bacterium]